MLCTILPSTILPRRPLAGSPTTASVALAGGDSPVVIGLGYLSWLPLNLAMPIGEVQWVGLSAWFPGIILLTLLLRITLAFIVLSMAKGARNWSRVDA